MIVNTTKTFKSANPDVEMLSFDTSSSGHIDCHKYSLLETLYDQRLHHFSFDQRFEILNSYLDDLRSNNLYMYKRALHSGCNTVVELEGKKKMINLASNDYLNMSQHPRVKSAVAEAVHKYGLGSGSVSMLGGTMLIHQMLENKLAAFKGLEKVMVFSSGYGTNIGVIRALLTEKDVAICDMYAHASLLDGCTNTNRLFFKHNDIKSLEITLQKASAYNNKLVIVDGVYSMDGDIALLDEIVDVAHKYGAWVLMDDAHGTGVIGMNGRGTCDYFDLHGKVDIVTGTFSKALGAVGGFVGGKKGMIDFLQIACRSYMFSTSPPAPVAAGVMEALHILEEEPQIMRNLHRNIQYFKKRVLEMGFNIGNTETAIIPLIIGNDSVVKKMALRLHEAGILVNPVPYPAVPKKLTRVRISLSAGLTQAQLDYALDEIERIGNEMGIIQSQLSLANA